MSNDLRHRCVVVLFSTMRHILAIPRSQRHGKRQTARVPEDQHKGLNASSKTLVESFICE